MPDSPMHEQLTDTAVLDLPLPGDVRIGSMTFRKGVPLRILVVAATRWKELVDNHFGPMVLPTAAQAVRGIPAMLATDGKMIEALEDARRFVQAELGVRLESYCLKGPDGTPDISTLSDEDGGASLVAAAQQALAKIEAALNGVASEQGGPSTS